MTDKEPATEVSLKKLPCSDIVVGVRFSEPVFFDDGDSMFLAPGKPAKEYHVESIARWKIPYLLCAGRALAKDEPYVPPAVEEELEEVEELDELDELDEVEELEECEAPEQQECAVV